MNAIRRAIGVLSVSTLIVWPSTLQGQGRSPAQRNRTTLDEAGRVVLAWGASARLRAEGWNNFAFGAPPSPPAGVEYDQPFGLARAFVHARLDWADRLGVYVQVKSAVSTGRNLQGGDRTSDVDEFDVQQAYLQARVPAGSWRLSATIGREDLSYGRERLVGVSDWSNVRRTFQGANVVAAGAGMRIKAFWTRPMQMRQYTWNIPDSTKQFYGVYASREAARYGADAYWLRSEADGARFNASPSRPDRRHTVGVRAYTRGQPHKGAADVELEAAYQFGDFGTADVSALLVALEAGWRPAASTRVHLGFDYGSGDDSTAGRMGTFNQLYPTGHSVLGYIDVHGRPNVVDLWGGGAIVHRGTTLRLDMHNFWRASTKDALYLTDGSQGRAAGNGLSPHVGTEFDVTVRRALRPNLPFQAGYSVYLPGSFLEQSGTSETMHFGYVQLGWVW